MDTADQRSAGLEDRNGARIAAAIASMAAVLAAIAGWLAGWIAPFLAKRAWARVAEPLSAGDGVSPLP